MAWQPPTPVSDGDYWKASDFNRFIRDNLAQSEAAVATSRGDIIASAGPGALTAGRVHVQSIGDGIIMDTASTSWARLSAVPPLENIEATAVICVILSGTLYRAYLDVRIVNSDGETVVDRDRGRSAINGLSNARPVSKMFAYQVPGGVYRVELWGCKNPSSGQSANGVIQKARLSVIAI